jgi:hypothetical protein
MPTASLYAYRWMSGQGGGGSFYRIIKKCAYIPKEQKKLAKYINRRYSELLMMFCKTF